MEQESINENINSECFELPPLKDMKEIISEFENSGVADEPSIFNINEMDADLEKGDGNTVNSCNSHSTEKDVEMLEADKAEFEMLDEQTMTDIEFEISKDIFDDIKIKDEEISLNISQVALQLGQINSKNEEITSVLPDIQQNVTIEENIEMIDKSIDVEDIKKENDYANKIGESELQEINCLSGMALENVEFLQNEDTMQENRIDTKPSSFINSLVEMISLDNKEEFRDAGNYADNEKKYPIVSDNEITSMPQKDMANSCDKEINGIKVEKNLSPFITRTTKKKISSNENIISVIEAVVQASVKQENISSKCVKTTDVVKEVITDSSEMDINGETSNKETNSVSEMENMRRNIPMKKKTHGLFEVVVPLIGKNVMEPGNDTPFNHRYDLARQRNELRAKYQQKNPDFPIPNISYQEWRRQKNSRTKEQIEKEEIDVTISAMQLATVFTKITIRLLREYEKDQPNEEAMIKYFKYFECAPASPLSLLYAPHLVHTIMLCRGDPDLSPKLRRVANDCYEKCHVLFAIPEGYNFETIFTSEVKKNIPDEFDHLDELELNYGEYDSSDFEDDDSIHGSDSDDNWE